MIASHTIYLLFYIFFSFLLKKKLFFNRIRLIINSLISLYISTFKIISKLEDGKGDKKKKVGFKDEVETSSQKAKEPGNFYKIFIYSAKPPEKKVNTEYLDKLFNEIDLQVQIKSLWSEIIEKKNSNLRDKIFQIDGTFPAPKGEQNLKLLISKWNADITKTQLLNKLVKPTDTVKAKNEIQTKLKLLHQNPENFRVSDGFKTIEAALGVGKVNNIIKDKKIEDELVITRRQRTPTYTEKKKVLQAEWTERMKDTQNLIQSVSNIRKEIRIKSKVRKSEEQKKAQQKQQKIEEKLKTKEQEKELLRAKKLQEIEEKRKKAEEDKQKQLFQMKEYAKKFDLKNPRYKEMEEKYNEKIEFSALDRKKKVLASLRDLHQPLNMEAIEEEQKKYEEIVKQNNEKKREELMQKLRENESTYDYKQYTSRYMERIIENEMMNKEKQMEEQDRKLEYQSKMREYDETIKQKYMPIPSKRKQEELEKIKAELTMNPKDKVRRSSPVTHSDQEELHALALKRKKIFEWKNSMKPPTPVPK